jgi:diphthamide synthase (EF-2-diphthine--ammonia ligase)
MLRESIKAEGDTVDLEGLTDSSCKEIAGIEHSKILLEFADVFMTRDAPAVAEVRDRLEQEMGVEAVIDAAGVASNFQRMDRIADATGLRSGEPIREMQQDLVDQLGLDQYASAANTLGQ